MLKEVRQNLILERLQNNLKVTTKTLAEDFIISEDTIRRDLNELADKGLLSKIHGGAKSMIQKLYYYNENVIKNQKEKKIIAEKAINLLKGGMSIIITDGTTNLAFARSIPKHLNITVFTYCLPIAMELTTHPNIELIFLGGKIEKKSMVSIGIDVLNKFDIIHVDMCFLGTGSIGHNEGITEGSYEVSLIKRAIVAASKNVISLATSDKLELRQPHSICRPNQISVLITELNPTDVKLSQYARFGIEIL